MGKDHPNWKKHFCISLKMEHRESITALSKQVAQPCVITTCLILGVRINSYLKKKREREKNRRRGQGGGKTGQLDAEDAGQPCLGDGLECRWLPAGPRECRRHCLTGPCLFQSGHKTSHTGLNFQDAGRLYRKKSVSLDSKSLTGED